MRFALLNASRAGAASMAKIGEALKMYAAVVCDAWERAPVDLEWMPNVQVAPEGYTPLVAFDHPDVTGALGYHDVDPQGRPYGRAFLDVIPGGNLLHDPTGQGASLASVLAHELAETIMDALASFFSVGPFIDPRTGMSYPEVAIETADPCQETPLTITLPDSTIVDASDFIYEQWFNTHAPPGTRFDHVGVLARPLTLAPGGYVIVRRPASEQDVDVFGEAGLAAAIQEKTPVIEKVESHERPPAPWRAKMREHSASRSWRRGVRLLRCHGRA